MAKDEVDRFRTIAWSHCARDLTQMKAYSLETFFADKPFGRNTNNEQIRQNRWYGYLSGKHVPSADYVDTVDRKFKEPKNWLESDLWAALRKRTKIEELYKILAYIRPKLSLYLQDRNSKNPGRIKSFNLGSAIDSLFMQGDINALIALIAVLRISSIEDDFEPFLEALPYCRNIAICIIANSPLYSERENLYQYLFENILSSAPECDFEIDMYEVHIDISCCIDLYKRTLLIAEDFGINFKPKKNKGLFQYWLFIEGYMNKGYSCIPLLHKEGQILALSNVRDKMQSDHRRTIRRSTDYQQKKLKHILEELKKRNSDREKINSSSP